LNLLLKSSSAPAGWAMAPANSNASAGNGHIDVVPVRPMNPFVDPIVVSACKSPLLRRIPNSRIILT
jgi:hypothetical protein